MLCALNTVLIIFKHKNVNMEMTSSGETPKDFYCEDYFPISEAIDVSYSALGLGFVWL